MLVLSRQRDESIIIGDNIVVTVVDVRGDKVRLGIEAPREVSVHRREIYEAIQRENKQAAQIRLDEARQIGKSPRSPIARFGSLPRRGGLGRVTNGPLIRHRPSRNAATVNSQAEGSPWSGRQPWNRESIIRKPQRGDSKYSVAPLGPCRGATRQPGAHAPGY